MFALDVLIELQVAEKSYADLGINIVDRALVLLTIASFPPQYRFMKRRNDCTGLSLTYLLLNLIVATYGFTLCLEVVAIHWEGTYLVHQPRDFRDWLNLAQFTVAWLGHLIL